MGQRNGCRASGYRADVLKPGRSPAAAVHATPLKSLFRLLTNPVTMGFCYAALAIYDGQLAYDTLFKECVDNFEGGCGYGKFMAGVLSGLIACVLPALAAGVALLLPAGVSGRTRLLVGVALGLPPVTYLVWLIVTVASRFV